MDLATKKGGRSALYASVELRNMDVMGALLDAKANVDIQTTDSGRTPLYLASRSGFTDGVRRLIAAGANANIAANDGSTPAGMAKAHGNVETQAILEGHGGNVVLPPAEVMTAILAKSTFAADRTTSMQGEKSHKGSYNAASIRAYNSVSSDHGHPTSM